MMDEAAENKQPLLIPNVIGVGFEKAGTSYFNQCLAENPLFLTPARKETFFFNQNYEKGLGFYQDQFRPKKKPDARFVCDITPSYRLKLSTLDCIKESVPEARIVVALRNPVVRAYSHYVWDISRSRGFRIEQPYSNSFFDDAVTSNTSQFTSYLEVLDRVHELFPADRVLILVNEVDLKPRSESARNRINTFFGIDNFEFALPTSKRGELTQRISDFPHYLYSGARPCRHDFYDKSYLVPPNTLVLCASKPRGIWSGVNRHVAARAILASTRWTRRLNKHSGEELFERFFLKDTETIESRYGLDLSCWREFKDIEYPLAPPPAALELASATPVETESEEE